MNALVHRDYSFSGSIIINVNDARIEFISLGGLMPGLSLEDIRSGISQPRNRNLAEVFHRLRLIESYGTGIRRIFHLYKGCPVPPEIHVPPMRSGSCCQTKTGAQKNCLIAAQAHHRRGVIDSS